MPKTMGHLTTALMCCTLFGGCTYTYRFSPEHDANVKKLIAQNPSREITYSDGVMEVTPGPVDNIVGFISGRVIHPFYNVYTEDYYLAINDPNRRVKTILMTPVWLAWSALEGPERAACDISLAHSGPNLFNYTHSFGVPEDAYLAPYIDDPVPMPQEYELMLRRQQQQIQYQEKHPRHLPDMDR